METDLQSLAEAYTGIFLWLTFLIKTFVIITIRFCNIAAYLNALNLIYHLPLQLPNYIEMQRN